MTYMASVLGLLGETFTTDECYVSPKDIIPGLGGMQGDNYYFKLADGQLVHLDTGEATVFDDDVVLERACDPFTAGRISMANDVVELMEKLRPMSEEDQLAWLRTLLRTALDPEGVVGAVDSIRGVKS